MAIKNFVERPRVYTSRNGVDTTPVMTPGERSREHLVRQEQNRINREARAQRYRDAGFPKAVVNGVTEVTPGQFRVDDSKSAAVAWMSRQ